MKKILISSLFLLTLAFVGPSPALAQTDAGPTPGSFWYGITTTFENVNIFFTFNSEKKAEKALGYAERRLTQAKAAAESKNSKAVQIALTNYESKINLASESSRKIKDNERAEKLLTSIADNTSRHQEVLSGVLEKVPEEVRETIVRAIETSKRGQEEATQQIAELKSEIEQLRQEIAELKIKNENQENEQGDSNFDAAKQKPLNLDDYKIDELKKDENEKVEQYIQQLTVIKNEIDSLNDAGLGVKKKMMDSEIKVSDFRIEKLNALADLSPLEIITKTYEELIAIEEIRKKNTSFFLSDSLLDIYLYSLEVGKVITSFENGDSDDIFTNTERIIDQHKDRIEAMKVKSEAAIESAIAENKAYAQEFLLRMESTNSLADRYSSALSVLQEIEEARKEIERITTPTSQESYYIPTYFPTTEPKSSTGSLTCKYPTNKYILVPGKGWQAVKQCNDGRYIEADKYVPDTSNMTPQQICDMRKSAWLSQDALILPGPDCSDLGL
ncbi:MAG: hypothetical protein COV70_00225 [Parcubacteria group bacterium CG11_big_fil_rev_8_21_14_0_20_39_22]|nr:MAG: hypothetical protein COV70_00225 [Parcubacteria group bacterium CG11_big_fil_rev_8_21_14_0_20_39_22]